MVDTSPVKNSIYAMIRTWKYKYASSLHFQAKVSTLLNLLLLFCYLAVRQVRHVF